MIIIGLDESGNLLFRCQYSKCQICKHYINDYKCKYGYINIHTWNGSDHPDYVCEFFIKKNKQLNNHFVFRDYEVLPIKDYGKGLYRFNSKGEKIND